jgi:hypothetical protein
MHQSLTRACFAPPALLLVLSLVSCSGEKDAQSEFFGPGGGEAGSSTGGAVAPGGSSPDATGGSPASGGSPAQAGASSGGSAGAGEAGGSIDATGGGPGASGGNPGGGDSGAGGGGPGGTGGNAGGTDSGGSGGALGGTGGSPGSGGNVAGSSGGGSEASGGSPGGSGGSLGGSGGSLGGAGGSTAGAAGAAGSSGGAGGSSEFGFEYRLPEMHTLTCVSPDFPGGIEIDQLDQDWLCTFEQGSVHGYIYVQSTPTDTNEFCVPIMTTVQAQISIDGQVSALQNAQYDWGGNHHNDSLTFEYDGIGFEYYHSSFGYGWRACHPMDCARVDDGVTLEDGCTMERTRPVVCVLIEEDGSHAELVDTFEPCPGDPNYP